MILLRRVFHGTFVNMKKIYVLAIACSCSFFILVIQVLLLRILLRKEAKEGKIDDPAHGFISKVASLSFRHGFPLFIIDQKVFKKLQSRSDENQKFCKFLCLPQTIFHFATIGPLSNQLQKNSFIEALEAEKYRAMQFVGSDPVLLQHGLNSPILFHLLIISDNMCIHVSAFYERPGKFWWTGGYNPTEGELRQLYELGLKKFDFEMINKPAAFEKVEIHQGSIDGIQMFIPWHRDIFLKYPENTEFIECNYTQSKLFYDRFGRDESDEAEIFRSKAFKLLSKAKSLLDFINVPFWLSSGTCLGYYRECGFISYSRDVDIGIWIKDYKPEIISAFSTHDVPLTHSFGRVEDSFELSFREGDLKLDIFFFYEDENYVWNGGTQARTGKKFKYIFPKFTLCWTEFLELKIRIPCQIEDYIKANYGQNWFEPVRTWDWKSSPSNVIENGQWPVEEWPEVIQLLPLPDQT